MTISCPKCGQHYDVDQDYVGYMIDCETCGNQFLVKQPTRVPLSMAHNADIPSPRAKQVVEVESPPIDTSQAHGEAALISSQPKPAMRPLVCEMCGSSDLRKTDGVFVCQSCGTKYSVEEARKMMIAGTVNVAGTVKVDKSEKLQNLYKVARRAKEEDNNEQAAKYYDLILQEEADSWEANFYRTYFTAMDCRIADIGTSVRSVQNGLKNVIGLIANLPDAGERTLAYKEIETKVSHLALVMAGAAKNHFFRISYQLKMNDSSYKEEYDYRMSGIVDVCYMLGDLLEQKYCSGDKCISSAIFTGIWDTGVCVQTAWREGDAGIYISKIREYNPNYEAPKKGFCYIATSVYGSYDCPEVWTLRRFRDDTLNSTWYGRTFVKLYYAISPTLVTYYGESRCFQRFWRYWLDKLVGRLRAKGVVNLPYNDSTNSIRSCKEL